MRVRGERDFETLDDFVYDPLTRYRKAARLALDQAGQLPSPNPIDAVLSHRRTEEAFAHVVRVLAGFTSDSAAFNVQRDMVLDFLTGDNATFREPLVDTEEGQLIRIGRGSDGQVWSVTVMRTDGRPVTATDLRFPFRDVKDTDAAWRIVSAEYARKSLEDWSDPEVPMSTGKAVRLLDEIGQAEAMVGDDKYRQAAALYLKAKEAGFSSTRQLIIDEMHVSYNYAGQLVKRARDRGYLPPIKKRGTT